jgi:hypothetical protein
MTELATKNSKNGMMWQSELISNNSGHKQATAMVCQW